MRTQYSKDFEAFWKKWPGRYRGEGKPTKVGKKNAFDEWKLLDAEDKGDITTVVCSDDRIKNAGTQFLPDLERWLRARKWEDFL